MKELARIRALLLELNVALDALVGADSEPRYYDQDTSPFPADMHCRLVRAGKLTGFKSHGRVFVERTEMHRFIEAHKVDPTAGDGTSEDQAVRDILERCPTVKRGSHAA